MPWNGVKQRVEDLPARVLVLEDQIQAVRSEIHSGIDGLNIRLDALTAKASTNWPTIFAGIALVLTLVGAVGAAYIAPITVGMSYQEKITGLQNSIVQEKLDVLRAATELNSSKINEIEKHDSGTQEHFKEVDTQINWGTNTANIQKEDSWFRFGVLWKKVFGTEMPVHEISDDGPRKD